MFVAHRESNPQERVLSRGRCPILDHRVAELALRMPLRFETNSERGELPLGRLLARRVPASLIDRPKMGFGGPLADCLRGPLRSRMAGYVDGSALPALGLDPAPARRLWSDFLAGRAHRTDQVWNVFALAAWAEAWKPEPIAEVAARRRWHRAGQPSIRPVGPGAPPARRRPART